MELNKTYCGDALEVLLTFPDNYFDCVVTSPPYYGLRDYGTGIWVGGDETCTHRRDVKNANPDWEIQSRGRVDNGTGDEIFRTTCIFCGAKRVDNQIGLEETPEEYVAKLVKVFSEVRRTLKPTGVLWLNIGDTYAAYWGLRYGKGDFSRENNGSVPPIKKSPKFYESKVKPKDLFGIPWMLAFALRNDGWYLRQDIIWQKPNPMPESVADRCTKSHEYIFLLSKSQKYYFDAQAIAEPMEEYERLRRVREAKSGLNSTYTIARDGQTGLADPGAEGVVRSAKRRQELAIAGTRNKRSVWTVGTYAFPEAHFATFPPDLIVDCIKAGTSEKGCCAECGKPYVRINGKPIKVPGRSSGNKQRDIPSQDDGRGIINDHQGRGVPWSPTQTPTLSWRATCKCFADLVPARVLDPFNGSGTTRVVAEKLGRDSVGIELNKKYIEMENRRRKKEFGLFMPPSI